MTTNKANKVLDMITSKKFEKLNKELINRNMIYDNCGVSDYEEVQSLHSVYDWGYILTFDCLVMPTRYDLYDNRHQFICSLDKDDDKFEFIGGSLLVCEREGFNDSYIFTYGLTAGAPIHVEDVHAILIFSEEGSIYPNETIIFTKTKDYCKKDGEPIKDITDRDLDVIDYMDQGYELIPEDCYQNHVNAFNDMLVTKK
jgi:hypothetical protein